MASIRRRATADGKTTYRVQLRVRAFSPQTATSARKTGAKRWAEQTGRAIHEGRYLTPNEARRHTPGELVDRDFDRIAKTRPHPLSKQRLLG
jgi:predicted aminopeptidase